MREVLGPQPHVTCPPATCQRSLLTPWRPAQAACALSWHQGDLPATCLFISTPDAVPVWCLLSSALREHPPTVMIFKASIASGVGC